MTSTVFAWYETSPDIYEADDLQGLYSSMEAAQTAAEAGSAPLHPWGRRQEDGSVTAKGKDYFGARITPMAVHS